MSVNSGGKRPQMQPQQANAGPLQGNDFHKVPLVYHFTDLPENLTDFLYAAVVCTVICVMKNFRSVSLLKCYS